MDNNPPLMAAPPDIGFVVDDRHSTSAIDDRRSPTPRQPQQTIPDSASFSYPTTTATERLPTMTWSNEDDDVYLDNQRKTMTTTGYHHSTDLDRECAPTFVTPSSGRRPEPHPGPETAIVRRPPSGRFDPSNNVRAASTTLPPASSLRHNKAPQRMLQTSIDMLVATPKTHNGRRQLSSSKNSCSLIHGMQAPPVEDDSEEQYDWKDDLEHQSFSPADRMFKEEQWIVSDEQLARSILEHENNNHRSTTTFAKNTSVALINDHDDASSVTDARLATRLATMLLHHDDDNNHPPISENVPDIIVIANPDDSLVVAEQHRILEQIRRQQQTEEDEHQRVHRQQAHWAEQQPVVDAMTLVQETPEQIQRRQAAYERQFYDRNTGSLQVTVAERQRLTRKHSGAHLEPYTRQDNSYPFPPYYYDEQPTSGVFQNTPTTSQSTPSYTRSFPKRPVSAGHDDWEASQRQELLQYEQARMLQSRTDHSPYRSTTYVGSERQTSFSWQQSRLSQPMRLPSVDPSTGYSDDGDDMMRRGQEVTQHAVRTGQAHIILCNGCGYRLQAPGTNVLCAVP
jgi:hypothetical protein